MSAYTVSFFGHREIENHFIAEQKIEEIVKETIRNNIYTNFLVGRDGEFDLLAASVVHRTIREYECINASLVLVLPYMRSEIRDNEQSFLDYYDDIEICVEASKAHFKSAIQIRNKYMIDSSELVVCCIERESGGAYKTVRYAKKQGKQILNVGNYNI